MPTTRRHFLLQGFISTICGLSCKIASAWSAPQFATSEFAKIYHLLVGNTEVTVSNALTITVPDNAENGAAVPFSISSELQDIELIYILVEKNPTPLAAQFALSPKLLTFVSGRIKMAESCHIVVLAKQGPIWLQSQRWVNVMIGGCGTG